MDPHLVTWIMDGRTAPLRLLSAATVHHRGLCSAPVLFTTLGQATCRRSEMTLQLWGSYGAWWRTLWRRAGLTINFSKTSLNVEKIGDSLWK